MTPDELLHQLRQTTAADDAVFWARALREGLS